MHAGARQVAVGQIAAFPPSGPCRKAFEIAFRQLDRHKYGIEAQAQGLGAGQGAGDL